MARRKVVKGSLLNSRRFIPTENDIRNAYENSINMVDAGRLMGISHWVFRKWAKLYTNEEGISYFDLMKQRGGKRGKSPLTGKMITYTRLKKIMKGEWGNTIRNHDRFKYALFQHGFFKDECHICGFSGVRPDNYRSPIVVVMKDGNWRNGKQDNIELLCYNHYFLQLGTAEEFNRQMATLDRHQVPRDFSVTQIIGTPTKIAPHKVETEIKLTKTEEDNLRLLGIIE